jgi:hypothetical protein
MRRLLLLAPFILAAALPPATAAAVPDYQRVITSRHADAALVSLKGCVMTEVFVSSMDGAFGGRPGPINRQGLTGVLVRQSDMCEGAASMGGIGVFAAGGGSGTILFDGLGQTLDPLESTIHFDRAWVRASIPMINEAVADAEETVVTVDLVFTLVGDLERDTGHLHVAAPGEGNVNSHQNTLSGSAIVSGTVVIDGDSFSFSGAQDAHLQQVKYGCQVIARPAAEDPDLSC